MRLLFEHQQKGLFKSNMYAFVAYFETNFKTFFIGFFSNPLNLLREACLNLKKFACFGLRNTLLGQLFPFLYLSIWIESKSIVWDSACSIH